jgi:hypothetical protein
VLRLCTAWNFLTICCFTNCCPCACHEGIELYSFLT